LANGFRPGTRGWCGGGIYFATTENATHTKAIGKDSAQGCMLKALVDVGTVEHRDKRCRQMHKQSVHASQHFDSISFDPSDGKEYVLSDPERIKNIQWIPVTAHRPRWVKAMLHPR